MDNNKSNSFIFDINHEDPLFSTIKGHLYIESLLMELIRMKLVNENELNLSRLSFPVKVDLAIALGAVEKVAKSALLKLNEIRNKIAHDLYFELSDENVDIFLNDITSFINLSNYVDKNVKREKYGWSLIALYLYLQHMLKERS